MPQVALRVVLDTNVLLAGMVSASSASQKIVDALSARYVVPLISPSVIAEYRTVLLHPEVAERFPRLSTKRVELALARLRYVGDFYRPGGRFAFERDPNDAKFLELAIAGAATHIITLDSDLLSLRSVRTDAGKRFRQRLPTVAVQTPQRFVDDFSTHLGLQ